jgi:hypothetical protein
VSHTHESEELVPVSSQNEQARGKMSSANEAFHCDNPIPAIICDPVAPGMVTGITCTALVPIPPGHAKFLWVPETRAFSVCPEQPPPFGVRDW